MRTCLSVGAYFSAASSGLLGPPVVLAGLLCTPGRASSTETRGPETRGAAAVVTETTRPVNGTFVLLGSFPT